MSGVSIATAVGLASQLLQQALQVSQLIHSANAEGRDTISEADLDKVVGADDVARAQLVDALARAKAEGR